MDGGRRASGRTTAGPSETEASIPTPRPRITVDAEALYHVLLDGVIPRFFDRDEKGLPREWIKTMKTAIESAVAPFSAHRMVRDYVLGSYLPVADTRER